MGSRSYGGGWSESEIWSRTPRRLCQSSSVRQRSASRRTCAQNTESTTPSRHATPHATEKTSLVTDSSLEATTIFTRPQRHLGRLAGRAAVGKNQ